MSRGTLDPAMSCLLSFTGLSPSVAGLSSAILLASMNQLCSPNPGMQCIPVWAHPISLAATLGIDVFFLLLRLLRCFSSPGSLRMTMDSSYGDGGLLRRVSPFRDLRVKGYVLLTAAYRSLSRLSSALSAKASTLRSY